MINSFVSFMISPDFLSHHILSLGQDKTTSSPPVAKCSFSTNYPDRNARGLKMDVWHSCRPS